MGLTPARFDVMVAIGRWGATQSEVRQALGVARSTVSELVDAVATLGLVRRSRAVDRRTWQLHWTARGRELLERAFGECINEGLVPLAIDSVLASDEPEVDALGARFRLVDALTGLGSAFGRGDTPDLYAWHPDDYLGAFAELGLKHDGVPFVT